MTIAAPPPGFLLVLATTMLLAACDGGGDSHPLPPPRSAAGWEIGPVVDGQNFSEHCPRAFETSFDIGPCEPHYVTRPTASLAGKKQIRARFRVVGDAEIRGAKCAGPSAVTLYFEASNVNWSKDGYRWWATFASHQLVGTGEFEIVAPLDGRWTSVSAMNSADNAGTFARDKANAGRIGFTFANCTGYGHGATASAPVSFTVLSFDVDDERGG